MISSWSTAPLNLVIKLVLPRATSRFPPAPDDHTCRTSARIRHPIRSWPNQSSAEVVGVRLALCHEPINRACKAMHALPSPRWEVEPRLRCCGNEHDAAACLQPRSARLARNYSPLQSNRCGQRAALDVPSSHTAVGAPRPTHRGVGAAAALPTSRRLAAAALAASAGVGSQYAMCHMRTQTRTGACRSRCHDATTVADRNTRSVVHRTRGSVGAHHPAVDRSFV